MRFIVLLCVASCTTTQPVPTPSAPTTNTTPPASPVSAHLALGTPRDSDPSDDVILDRQYFVVSYNPKRNVANWVAWKLEGTDLGSVKRSNKFHRDDSIAQAIEPFDYAKSGYDRGHLCPSGDRTSSPDANYATFAMSNMHPQHHDLNTGPWEALESFSRDEAKKHKVLYIVAGGVFAASPPTIGHGVAVPEKAFKVILELDPGQDPSMTTPAIAAIMPNQAGIHERAWTDYVTTIDDVEQVTGYDFFDRVPKNIQDVIEAKKYTP